MSKPADLAETIKRLRERYAKATPGPWKFRLFKSSQSYGVLGKDNAGLEDVIVACEPEPRDAALIVDAVNSLPALLDALEAAQRELASAEDDYERVNESVREARRDNARLQAEVERLRGSLDESGARWNAALVEMTQARDYERALHADTGAQLRDAPAERDRLKERAEAAERGRDHLLKTLKSSGDAWRLVESALGVNGADSLTDVVNAAEKKTADLAAAQRRIEALERVAAFATHHRYPCEKLGNPLGSMSVVPPDAKCNCGLDAARTAASETKEPT